MSPIPDQNNNRYFYFVNPLIVKKSGSFTFEESCLSFPHQTVITKRYQDILVKADNIEGLISFYADSTKWSTELECACIQHEIDHLNGITMFQRKAPPFPYVRKSKKIGRNSLCPCNSGKKYKKCCENKI